MIDYVTIGTNDLERARAFYDALLPLLGGRQDVDMGRLVFYRNDAGETTLAVCRPHDGKAASAGNGTMVALEGGARETVDAVHRKAMELGAADEGAPGERSPGFYAGYFRDLDGNKLVVKSG